MPIPTEPVLVANIALVFEGALEGEDADGASEVIAYEDGKVYTTNGENDRIDIFALDGSVREEIDLSLLPDYDGVQSVAIKNGLIAVAVSTENTEVGEGAFLASQGYVAFYSAETLELIETVTVGNLPDQVAFSADGKTLLVANEGEFNEDSIEDGVIEDPAGSISVISIKTLPGQAGKGKKITEAGDDVSYKFNVKEAGFEKLNKFDTEGVRFNPNSALGLDLEPEYNTFSPDGKYAYTTLQENNAVAVTNVKSGKVVDIIELGTVDHSVVPLDPNDKDGEVNFQTFPNLVGLRMPDAIVAFEIDGKTYFATANEGDGRGDYFLTEENEAGDDVLVGLSAVGDEARVSELIEFGPQNPDAITIDPALLDKLENEGMLDDLLRLTVSVTNGDTDGDGDIDVLHAYGSRSATIFDEDGNVVWDSGNFFAEYIADNFDFQRFQTDEPFAEGEEENRSDAKGAEPEAIEVGVIDGDTFLFVGMERDSGIFIFNISDPEDPHFQSYINGYGGEDFDPETEGNNVSPEVLEFVSAQENTEGDVPLLLASYEVSGTSVAYELSFDLMG